MQLTFLSGHILGATTNLSLIAHTSLIEGKSTQNKTSRKTKAALERKRIIDKE
jgi:hypothetical protein